MQPLWDPLVQLIVSKATNRDDITLLHKSCGSKMYTRVKDQHTKAAVVVRMKKGK